MKTDLTTTGSYAQSKARKLGTVGDPTGLGKPLDTKQLKKMEYGPDYKLDLSSKAPADTSIMASTSTPSLPSIPTPEVPKIKLPDVPKEVIKDEVAKEVKTEIIKEVIKDGSVKKPAILFIKGLDLFSSPSKSERGYAGVGKMADSIEGSKSFGWSDHGDILEEIRKTHRDYPIILVGHSLGGDTAVEIANTLDSLDHKFRPVDLLITMDAIGFNNDIIPQNVKNHLNVFGENNMFLNDGPHVARRHEMTTVKNILSPKDHTELDDEKDIQYEVVSLIQKTLGPGLA